MSAASHGAATSVHHETDQEAAMAGNIRRETRRQRRPKLKPRPQHYSDEADPVWMGLATGLTLSEVSVAGLLGIRESSSYSFGRGTGVC